MATDVQYYFAPQSPWTYLGHLRFWDVARKHGARTVRVDDAGVPHYQSCDDPLRQFVVVAEPDRANHPL